jgi:PAS domain-containing protein
MANAAVGPSRSGNRRTAVVEGSGVLVLVESDAVRTAEVRRALEALGPEIEIVAVADGQRAVDYVFATGAFAGRPVKPAAVVTDLERALAANRVEAVIRALMAAPMGTWDWDIVHGRADWDATMHRIYALAPGEFASIYEGWQRRIHSDDRRRAADDMKSAERGERPFDCAYRIVLPTGEVRTIRALGRSIADASGKATRMLGLNIDITDRNAVEAAPAEVPRG